MLQIFSRSVRKAKRILGWQAQDNVSAVWRRPSAPTPPAATPDPVPTPETAPAAAETPAAEVPVAEAPATDGGDAKPA